MTDDAKNKLSQTDKELLSRVDEVLHYLWDPIGVSGVPQARDEYTSYAGVVFSFLKNGAKEAEIAQYLRKIRVEHMGIGTLTDIRGNEMDLAEILVNWKEVMDERAAQG